MSPNKTFNLDGVTVTSDEISVDQKYMPLNVIFFTILFGPVSFFSCVMC